MLRDELSCQKGRLLLCGLMLKDANPNHYAVPGVDCIVSHESWQVADDGHKALLGHLRHLLGVGHALEPPHCNVHSFSPPPKRRRDQSAPPQVDQRGAQCEGSQGLTQLPRNREIRSSQNFEYANFGWSPLRWVRISQVVASLRVATP